MTEPILDPDYWRRRLIRAAKSPSFHHSIYKCASEEWERIEEVHRVILTCLIQPNDSVLDCGCGYGRLLTLMPRYWIGDYLGVDHCPEFIALARATYPDRRFHIADLRSLVVRGNDEAKFDWAIMISIRPMVKRNCGDEVWTQIEHQIRMNAKKLLYLEYSENDEGSVE